MGWSPIIKPSVILSGWEISPRPASCHEPKPRLTRNSKPVHTPIYVKFELRYARGEFIEQVHHQSVLFNVHRDYERHCKFWRPGVAIA